METTRSTDLDLRGIGWFLAIAFGSAWLLESPMWLDGRGLGSPWAALILAVNFTPAVATFVVVRWISPLRHARRATGLRFGVPGTYWGLYWVFGWLGLIAFSVAAPFIGALLGLFPMDLTHFSGYRGVLESTPGGSEILATMSIRTLALLVLVTLPLQALLLTPFTFGEEWGWRGYLLPQLLPLGQWPALLISGAVWGFWHAPLILLGFNYPQHQVLGVFLMVIFCTIIGTILGWTRLETGSVWPAVLGHAGINSSQVLGGVAVLTSADADYDTAQVFLTGWTGWALPILFIALLVVTGRLPVRDAPDLAVAGDPEPEPPTGPANA